jgi:hypothetical protein
MGAEVMLGATLLAGVGQIVMGKKAAAAQKDAQKAQASGAEVERINALRERVRRARALRADVIQAGENQGVAGSSAVVGGAASTVSQTFSGAGYSNQLAYYAGQAGKANQKAADYQATGDIFGTIGGISNSLFTTSGGAETIFRGK